jgi:SAM-dependent methyltransferase
MHGGARHDPFVCPGCGGALQGDGADPIWRCAACRRVFPIPGGMPVLLPDGAADDVTARAFADQWTLHERGAFEAETIYGETAAEELQSFLDRFDVRSPAALAGCRILDIGCGSGRLTRRLAEYAPQAVVVGGDRSAAARIAYERCRGVANVHVAQLDLLRPPFAPASFDLVYADGVVPHVPDPDAALASLVRLLAPGGRLFVWVYPRRFSPYRALRDALGRSWRLPRHVRQSIAWAAGVPLWAAFKLWEPLRGTRRRGLREVVFMLHDNLAPEFQHRRRPDELVERLRALGCTDVRSVPPDTGVVATVGDPSQ